MVGGGRGGVVGLSLGVDGNSLVGNIGDVSVVVVGGVLDVLGSAVGEGHGVGAGDVAGGVSGLVSGESGLGVVVGNAVGVSVGSGLLLVGGSVGRGVVGSGGRGVVGSGSVVDNRGVVDSSGVVDNRGVVGQGVGHDVVGGSVMGQGMGHDVVRGGVVDEGGSMVGSVNSVANHGTVSVHDSVGADVRGRGGHGQTDKSTDNKSLKKYESISLI